MEQSDCNSLKLSHVTSISHLFEIDEQWALRDYELERGVILRKRLVYDNLEQL